MLAIGQPLPSIFEPRYEALVDALIRDYFFTVTRIGLKRFTGAHFETLGGEWYEPANRNVMTAGDLAAVSCLSVKVPGAAAIRVLQGQAKPISELLTAMPPIDATLWDVPESVVVDPEAPASQLWHLLRRGRDGLGPTTTSKLMARKRASLIPVFDTVVQEVLGLPSSANHWATMRKLMQTEVDGRALHSRLAESARRVGVDATVTPLRVFDVAVWYGYNPRTKVQSWVQKLQDTLVAEERLGQRWALRLR
ncbi:DUF6308 family protein [Janibacter alittae]|uniref:DUF6308 family protein n=1 Tax=Janibacter alittae TaxID=3115209 RepID=A0ABZ2MLL4_9MICO